MSKAQIVGGVIVDLADGPVRTSYGRSDLDGRPFAHLKIGSDLSLSFTNAGPEALQDLAEAIAELSVWCAQHSTKQVA